MDTLGFPFRDLFRGPRLAILLALLALGFNAPRTAHAQSHYLTRPTSDSLLCLTIDACDVQGEACDEGRTCELLPSGDLGCVTSSQGSITEVFCCQSSSDCDVGGVCSSTIDSVADLGICIGEPYDFFCEDPASVDLSAVQKCLSDTFVGDFLGQWFLGDCDDDGVNNIEDTCHCDDSDSCTTTHSPDAGSRSPDLGFTGKGGCTLTPAPPSTPLPLLLLLLIWGQVRVRNRL